MVVPPSVAWKLVLAVVLDVRNPPQCVRPRTAAAVPGADLRRLVLSALALYAVGGLASLTAPSGASPRLVYAAGIVVCALAA